MVKLSVIIPAHNEAGRINQTINQVMGFLVKQHYSTELIVVENGSHDQTYNMVREQITNWYPGSLRLIHLDQADKGQAVKTGMLEASGEFRYMADADLSTDINQIPNFIVAALQTGAGLVLGVRDPIIGQTKLRQLMSVGFSLAARAILRSSIKDTQAGFKLFTAEAAEAIYPNLKIMGWAFDVEVIYLAQQMGFNIAELPIPWTAQPGSKIKPWDPVRMLLDLARIRASHYGQV